MSIAIFPGTIDPKTMEWVPGCALCENPIETRDLPLATDALGECGVGWGADGALCEVCADAERAETDTRETDIPKQCPGYGG